MTLFLTFVLPFEERPHPQFIYVYATNMKALLTFLCLLPLALFAQDTTAVLQDTVAVFQDTTIYAIADEAPRFPTRCEGYDTTAVAKAGCSQIALLRYINKRALYTNEAREQGISGTAVIAFVVERSGYISRAEIMKDPGGGLGISALRAVVGMANEVRWRPAVKDSAFVRFKFILPVRFRIEAPKPYVVTDRDTVYVELTKDLVFNGHPEGLGAYFAENVKYPASGEDSCRMGQLDIQLLVHPDGRVDVQDIIDYSDLGTDFTFEAMNIATNTYGQWSSAEYEGRPVTAAYDLNFSFAPSNDACAETVSAYNTAVAQINEGAQLVRDTLTLDTGLAKMDLAVDAFPADGRFRILRGQALMDNNRLEGACEDLRMAKQIALIDWFDAILPLLCR